jgi:hypothetical protein
MSTYIQYTAKLTAGIAWLRAKYGERTAGWIALTRDQIVEGATEAFKARLAVHAPYDALGYLGETLQIERYPRDTTEMYRRRLLRAFPQHEQGGTRQAILTELAEFALGVTMSGLLLLEGAVLIEDWQWIHDPQPWWSQFWIIFPAGTHPVIGTSQEYGDGSTYGTGDVYGVEGITALDIAALRSLVKKWKRATSILRQFIFVVTGELYGVGGNVYGQVGLVYGPASVVEVAG